MKSKLLFIAALSTFAFSLSACPKPSDTTLTHQYETGALQWQVVRKEIDPHTLIHRAILENALGVIKFLLAQGVDVDYPDENGMSPLTVAILNGCTDVVRELLEHGANTNPIVRWNGMSLLELALCLEDKVSSNLLMEFGADVNCALQGQWVDATPLIVTMIYKKDLEMAKNMIHAGANINENDPKKNPLLISVLYDLPIDFVKFLIENGADVNFKYRKFSNRPEYKSPLFVDVIEKKNVGLVGVFVNARVNLKDCDYLSGPIANKYSPEIIRLLIENGASINGSLESPGGPIQAAIHVCNLDWVKLLIERGADVNMHHPNGRTPLLNAIQLTTLQLVRLLVDSGADVNKTIIQNGVVLSPLNHAINHNKPEVVQYLLKCGARG